MKKLVLGIAVLLVGLAGGAMLLSQRRATHWTTRSDAALAAFERCLDSDMKLYYQEALDHCEEALSLDPDFAVAKLKVAQWSRDEKRRKRLLAELGDLDLRRLTDREGLLVRHALARADHDEPLAQRLLAEHLAAHPRDPFALDLACLGAWEREEWEEAASCHERLLAADPNWVRAQNHRGYVAMGQGHFEEAEEHFRTYLYVAPDQANPHDSLAELLTLRGRYTEAERELAEALRIRPDFCASYIHLVTLYLLQRETQRAAEALGRYEAQESCAVDHEGGTRLRCAATTWGAALAGDWEAAWAAAAPCLETMSPDAAIVGHRAALRTGRGAAALEIETKLAARAAELASKGRRSGANEASALLAHARGVRLLAEGDAVAAVDDLVSANRVLRYWDGLGAGVFKLYNLSRLAMALAAAGRDDDAAATRRELAEINPAFAVEVERDPAP